jgi:hypothetical protein
MDTHIFAVQKEVGVQTYLGVQSLFANPGLRPPDFVTEPASIGHSALNTVR